MKLIISNNLHIYFNSTDSFRELFNFITKGYKINLNNWCSNKYRLGFDFIIMKR